MMRSHLFLKAMDAYDDDQPELALRLMEECANQDDPVACFTTALWYRKGEGAPVLTRLEELAEQRMYYDLGLYGDIAEDYMEELTDHSHVDLSGFAFDKFFPPESAGKNALLGALFSILPFVGYVARQPNEYLPLTLKMMENAMRAKQWRAVEHQ